VKKKKTQPAPGGKTLQELQEEAIAKGDVAGFLQLQMDVNYVSDMNFFWDRHLRDLRLVLKNAAAKNPEGLALSMMAEVLSFQSLIMLRAHNYVKIELLRHDQQCTMNSGSLPVHLVQEWLPRVERIHQEMKKTCMELAKIEHVFKLGQRTLPEGEGVIPFEAARQGTTAKDVNG